MKKIISLALLTVILSACTQPLAPLPTTYPTKEEAPTVAPTRTQTPLPTPTRTRKPTPTPLPTRTPFIGEISIEHAKIVYYEITGTTEGELRKSMDKLRPKNRYDNNKAGDALTEWYISWNWSGYGKEQCDLSTALVTYTITIHMPRWNPPVDASPQLIAKREKYIQKLALHEKGHADNIIENYLKVKTTIQGATCSTAEKAAQNTLDELRKFDVGYDRVTKHGATQGAIFP